MSNLGLQSGFCASPSVLFTYNLPLILGITLWVGLGLSDMVKTTKFVVCF